MKRVAKYVGLGLVGLILLFVVLSFFVDNFEMAEDYFKERKLEKAKEYYSKIKAEDANFPLAKERIAIIDSMILADIEIEKSKIETAKRDSILNTQRQVLMLDSLINDKDKGLSKIYANVSSEMKKASKSLNFQTLGEMSIIGSELNAKVLQEFKNYTVQGSEIDSAIFYCKQAKEYYIEFLETKGLQLYNITQYSANPNQSFHLDGFQSDGQKAFRSLTLCYLSLSKAKEFAGLKEPLK